jgi:hypothetical protein
MITQTPTLYLVLAAVIGIFIGLLIASLFTSRDSHPKTEVPKELLMEGFGEIARVWYSPVGKKIMVEMEGGYYKEFKALSKEQRSKVVRMVELLNGWVIEPDGTMSDSSSQAEKRSYQQIVPDRLAGMEEPYQPIVQEPVIEEEIVEAEAVIAEENPTSPFFSKEEEEADLVSVLKETFNESEQTPEEDANTSRVDLTITQQISAILDDMLAGTDLEGKGIRLWENPDHGVDVFVGDEKFEGIEAVPYPQVRQVIRDAVLRWEQENESQQRINE